LWVALQCFVDVDVGHSSPYGFPKQPWAERRLSPSGHCFSPFFFLVLSLVFTPVDLDPEKADARLSKFIVCAPLKRPSPAVDLFSGGAPGAFQSPSVFLVSPPPAIGRKLLSFFLSLEALPPPTVFPIAFFFFSFLFCLCWSRHHGANCFLVVVSR